MPSFLAAAEVADWNAPGFAADLVDLNGATVWPIVSPTFILLPTNPVAERVEGSRNTMRFFDWAYVNGSKTATELDYVPMPESVVKSVRALWGELRDSSGKPVPLK
jgi:phosphate transport system substrate-binding protein